MPAKDGFKADNGHDLKYQRFKLPALFIGKLQSFTFFFELTFQYLIFSHQIVNLTYKLLIDIQIQKLRQKQLRRSPETCFQTIPLSMFQ